MEVWVADEVVAVGCAASGGVALGDDGAVAGGTGGVSVSIEFCWGAVSVGSGGSVWRLTGTG